MSLRDKVFNHILTDRFWEKAKEVQTLMEPFVKVLKLVDQDMKPIISVIYKAMDRAKLAIKALVKIGKSIGKSLIKGGHINCIDICML